MPRMPLALALLFGLALSSCKDRSRSTRGADSAEEEDTIRLAPNVEGIGNQPEVPADPDYQIRDGLNHPSLPLLLRVGTKGKSFDEVPALANPPPSAVLLRRVGKCTYGLRPGHVEVQRYYLAGEQWIKATGEISAPAILRVDVGEDFYATFALPIFIHFSKGAFNECVKALRSSHRLTIGRASLQASGIDLLPGPQAAVKKVSRLITKFGQSQSLFLRWYPSDPYPLAEDDDGNTFYLQSPMYHAQFSRPGYYYLAIKPNLQILSSVAE